MLGGFMHCIIVFYRDTILKLLLDGARELGNIVCSHIRALLNELHTLRRRPDAAAAGGASGQSATAGTSSEDADNEAIDRSKGFLMVRYRSDFLKYYCYHYFLINSI